jgi:hypothetical protein
MEGNKQREVEKKSIRLEDADEIMVPRTEIHGGVGAAHFCLGTSWTASDWCTPLQVR